MYSVEITKMVDNMGLTHITPEIDISERVISEPDVNRPALQLAGFFDYFNYERVQIIGNVVSQDDRMIRRLCPVFYQSEAFMGVIGTSQDDLQEEIARDVFTAGTGHQESTRS